MGPNYTHPDAPWSEPWRGRLDALMRERASFDRMAEVDAMLRHAPRYLHYKMDGHQARLTHTGCHEPGRPWVKIESRIGTDQSEALAWHPSVKAFAHTAPMGASIWCEVYVPGADSSTVKTAINARDPRLRVDAFMLERARSCDGVHSWYEYHITDCIMGGGEQDWSLFTMSLECAKHIVESWGVPFLPFVRGDRYSKYVAEHGVGALCKWIADNTKPYRIEGIVLKDGNCTGMLKWKPTHTLDAVVTGWERGKAGGRHAHRVGALVVSLYDGDDMREVAKVSGMTDEERDYITDCITRDVGDARAILHRVCEVEYTGLGSLGRLRHPRFVRWREDKRPEDCTVDQLSHFDSEAPF